MDIADYFANFDIEEMDTELLKQIFHYSRSGISFSNPSPGVIIIENTSDSEAKKKIIHCVKNYYTSNSSGLNIVVSPTSPFLMCAYVKNVLKLGINGSDCARCHLMCMDQVNNGKLYRTKARKRRVSKVIKVG